MKEMFDPYRVEDINDYFLMMATAYEASATKTLPERLVRALETEQEAGGGRREKQSAAIRGVEGQPYPYLDLQVDEHPEPVSELRRVYAVARVEMLPFIEALPTRKNQRGDFGGEILGTLIPE